MVENGRKAEQISRTICNIGFLRVPYSPWFQCKTSFRDGLHPTFCGSNVIMPGEKRGNVRFEERKRAQRRIQKSLIEGSTSFFPAKASYPFSREETEGTLFSENRDCLKKEGLIDRSAMLDNPCRTVLRGNRGVSPSRPSGSDSRSFSEKVSESSVLLCDGVPLSGRDSDGGLG